MDLEVEHIIPTPYCRDQSCGDSQLQGKQGMWSGNMTYIEDIGMVRIWPDSDTQMAGGCADRVVTFGYILKYTQEVLLMDWGRKRQDTRLTLEQVMDRWRS